jgi:hypothetical protein
MKRIILLAACTAIIGFSCKEDFEPKAPFKQQYVLNAVIRGDSTAQVALVAHSYDVDGFDPYTNTNDPFLKGVPVFLKYKGQLYPMRDTLVSRDTSRYTGLLNAYVCTAFTPVAGDSVQVLAYPESGVVLSSSTKVPSRVSFTADPKAILVAKTQLNIVWTNPDKEDMFLPRLIISYRKRSENQAVTYNVEVPLSIDSKGNKFYPEITKIASLQFEEEIIDKTMREIAGTNDYQDYKFVKLQLDMLIYDEFLSTYVSSTHGFFDNLSIRLDEPNFTNIKGGLGFFGATERLSFNISLTNSFVQDLGFTP